MTNATLLRASYGQTEWFQSVAGGNSNDNVMAVFELNGPLDVEALSDALRLLAMRHETLRTSLIDTRAGVHQLVTPEIDTSPQILNFTGKATNDPELHRVLESHIHASFALTDSPLWRTLLLRLDSGSHILAIALSHAIADQWSYAVLHRDLTQLYEHVCTTQPTRLPDLTIQFADYAAWERDEPNDPYESYWQDRILPLPPRPHLPTSETWHPGQPFVMAAQTFPPLPPEDVFRLREIASAKHHTLATALNAAVVATVLPYFETEILIGVLYANRDIPALRDLIAPLIDHVPVRVRVPPEATFLDLIEQIGSDWDYARSRRLPLGRITAALAQDGALSTDRPIFDVAANYWPWSPDDPLIATTPKGPLSFAFHPANFTDTKRVTLTREISMSARLSHTIRSTAAGAIEGSLYANPHALGTDLKDLANRFPVALSALAHNPTEPLRHIIGPRALNRWIGTPRD